MKRSAYAFYFVANFTPRLMMFFLLLILTHIMPMDEYGRFVLVAATGELFDMAVGGWVRIFALRSESASGTLRPLESGRVVVLTLITTSLSVTAATGIALIRSDSVLAFAIAVIAYVLAFAPLRLALTFLQIRRMHLTYAAIEMLRAGGTLVAVTAVTLAIGPSFVNASLALAAATTLAALIGLVQALRGVARPQLARTGYVGALVFGLPIIAAIAMNYSIGLIDRYVVDIVIGPHAVAILAAAYSFARQPIELFLGPLNNYAFPHLVRIYEQDGAAATGRAQAGLLITSSMIGGAITVGITLLGTPLLTIFLPPDYVREGASLVPWLAVGAYFLTAKVFIFDNVFHLSKKTWKLPLAMLVPGMIGFALCVVLVPRFGLPGAAVSYAVAGVLFCVASALVAGPIVRTPIPWAGLVRIAVAMLAAAVALIGARSLLGTYGAVAELAGSTLAFVAVYGALLTLFGFSLRRIVEMPWSPMGGTSASNRWAAALSRP